MILVLRIAGASALLVTSNRKQRLKAIRATFIVASCC
jgi:hypothetical protein